MSYEILKHTADLRMKVSSGSLEELFKEAFMGMMNILRNEKLSAKGGSANGGEMRNKKAMRTVTMYASDKTALLVDFLNEALSLAQIHKEAYTSVAFSTFSEIALQAVLLGVKVNEFDEDIKAVTYHEADVRQNEKGEWETILVFDI